ncbi:Protein Malvolio-like protein [Dinothrombium tinctorium]|uniref:Protein Malvolio-like protein n=1 Tax=Dinothrombium tinctorium TaxID=1965070 RepID=A0A3S3PRT5_9ACAR|nr:Protein Malvolio-like protein [Dinothrombium tinctorium]RWS13618.1 Protein Malvolio-like protein [Dinothrombium tinctorium]
MKQSESKEGIVLRNSSDSSDGWRNDGQEDEDCVDGIRETIEEKVKKCFRKHDDTFEDEINVTETDNESFSFKKLWQFTGPAFIMCIAYIDPGSIQADLQTGTVAGYRLMWLLLVSTIFGIIVQRLASRLGLVTSCHLAESCHNTYPLIAQYILWIFAEAAIILTNVQEVIGTAVAIYILSDAAIPIFAGIIITIIDTLLFLLLSNYGLRKLELLFGILIAIMIQSFGSEYVKMKPDTSQVLKGLVIPWCLNCSKGAFKRAVFIVGSTIMPQNLYLHSALVTSRKVDRSKPEEIKDANRYELINLITAFVVTFLINVGITSVFAAELHGKTNLDIHNLCAESNYTRRDEYVFQQNNKTVEINLYNAGVFLACRFPAKIAWPMYAWAIGLFASGLSSTMSGTYTGQFVMFGFLKIKMLKWKRILLTRSIAIVPTLIIAFFTNINNLSQSIDFINAIMSLLLPFALIPLLTLTSSQEIMGEFKNGYITIIITSLILLLTIALNSFFIHVFFFNFNPQWYTITLSVIMLLVYISLILYLVCFYDNFLLLTEQIFCRFGVRCKF